MARAEKCIKLEEYKHYIIIIVAIAALAIYLKSPAVKGRRSEKSIARRLKIDSVFKQGGKIITNIYIPKETDDTSEIDVLSQVINFTDAIIIQSADTREIYNH